MAEKPSPVHQIHHHAYPKTVASADCIVLTEVACSVFYNCHCCCSQTIAPLTVHCGLTGRCLCWCCSGWWGVGRGAAQPRGGGTCTHWTGCGPAGDSCWHLAVETACSLGKNSCGFESIVKVFFIGILKFMILQTCDINKIWSLTQLYIYHIMFKPYPCKSWLASIVSYW